jgi:hypothetical protein
MNGRILEVSGVFDFDVPKVFACSFEQAARV